MPALQKGKLRLREAGRVPERLYAHSHGLLGDTLGATLPAEILSVKFL